MNQKLWTKVLASLLVMTLTLTNFVLLGVYASKSYATSDNLERQETVTNNENVTFDAYFKDEQGNKTHTTRQSINQQDLKLYIAIQVKKGYLKNAMLQIAGENGTSSNVKIKSSNEALEYIESVDESSNIVKLKQVNAGTQVIFELPVVASKDDNYDLSNFSKLNHMILTGSYVGDTGKETKIEKTIQTRNEWTEQATPMLEQQVIRFIPYQVNQKTGTILQTLVRSGIENNILPIKENKLTITVPTVNGKNPTSVTVVPSGILATNGATQESFTEENWAYDNITGKLTITVKNEASDNKVSWLKTGKDDFIITYQYNEKVDTLQAVQNATSEIKVYNSVETNISKNDELQMNQNEILGQIVTANMQATESVSKGYLYSKVEKETSYQEMVTVDISYPELVDELSVKQDMDYFVNEAGEISPTTISDINYAYYKTTKISKANFEKILGAEGTLTIKTLAGEELVTFNKDTIADENGNYVFSYEGQVNQIVIVTSKPVENGKLEIKHEKVLKGKTDYSKAQVESFKTLKVMANVEAKAEGTIISNVEAAKEITLVAPTTKIETQVSNANLSTVVTNENVELRVILKTNDISCDLYKNPTVEMVLPNYISKLNIKDINLLFDNGLNIQDYNTYVNESGNIVIKVNMTGEQTTYSQDEISKGANLIINTDITLKQLTPTRDDVMKVYVTNELATAYENQEQTRARMLRAVTTTSTATQKGYSETSLRAVAPVGMVTTNTISGYNAKNETVTSMSSQEQTGKLDVKKEARTATASMSIINNYQNVVNHVSILGRVPTSGSKNADTQEDFGSNLALQMASAVTVAEIDASNIEVYYSTNASATKDITLAANGWTKDTTNLASMKSYLVVVNGDIATGTTLTLSYNLAIPENVSYNMQAYSNYVVYFDNVKTEGTISEKSVATKVGLATGEGPELAVSIKADIANGEKAQEGDIITYTVTVKNVGKSEVKNITLKGNIPEGTVYVTYSGNANTEEGITITRDESKKEYSELINTLAVGEEKSITYHVEVMELEEIDVDGDGNEIVGDDSDYEHTGDEEDIEEEEEFPDRTTIRKERDLIAYGSVTVENYDVIFTSETITNRAVRGFLKANMEASPIPESTIRMEGDEVEYAIYIENINDDIKNNVIATYQLPDGMEFIEASENGTYDVSTRTVTWKFDTMEEYDNKVIILKTKISKLANNEYEKTFENKVTVKTADNEVTTNTVTIKVQKSFLSINQTTDTKSTVSVGDTITYNATISNKGAGTAHNVQVTDEIPQGTIYVGAQYIYRGQTYNVTVGNTKAYIIIPSIEAGEIVDIKIQLKADSLPENTTEKEIRNVVKVSSNEMEEIESNVITHKIVATTSSNDDPSIDEIIEGTNKISGIAWLDSNNDGKRNDEEERLAGIEVMLINAENGQIVRDPVTGKDKIQMTNEKGEYTFANIEQGKYMVVFLYDSGNFAVTTYQKEGVNTNKNSDVISMKVNVYGENRIAAVTDKLVINGSNIDNIDMGLVVNKKFDLRLDKVITKITLNNLKETTEQEYQDAKVAKFDIPAKQVDSSSIMVEYKIRVTNEGGVAGYAKKIVDYMPTDMKFSSELNPDWYASDNGTNLYNASLANTLIQPGETKELTLLLTKKMTADNMGVINNMAEIYESDNDLGLADMDSAVANKVQEEDDMSSADAIIGTKTGEIYILTLLTLTVIAMFGVGIYIINKKVLPRV